MVFRIVFGKTYALQILVVEPVHIRMSEPGIARPAVDLAPVHIPQVRHDVNVVLGNVGADVPIDDLRVENREHVIQV